MKSQSLAIVQGWSFAAVLFFFLFSFSLCERKRKQIKVQHL